jgi:hypothetical protein
LRSIIGKDCCNSPPKPLTSVRSSGLPNFKFADTKQVPLVSANYSQIGMGNSILHLKNMPTQPKQGLAQVVAVLSTRSHQCFVQVHGLSAFH